MKLIITRHGESEENSLGILQGLLPGKLNDIGRHQAEKLGQRLSKEKIDIIYCSPVNRCLETLEHIKKYIDPTIPITISDLIKERDFGKFSGKKWSEVNFDDLDKDTKANQELGVESLAKVSQRTKKFIEDLESKHQNQTVLVVSHSNPLRMVFAHLLNLTFSQVLEKVKIKNASVSVFEVGDTVVPIVINETDFLAFP
jgi:broad specificity phosphatase PhoE